MVGLSFIWFWDYLAIQQGGFIIKHPTTREGKVVHYREAYEVNYHQMTLAHLLLMVTVGNLGFTLVIDFGMHLKKTFLPIME